MVIKLSHFSTIYQLFAGISSALAGLHFTKKYILRYLESHISKQTEEIQNLIVLHEMNTRTLHASSQATEEQKAECDNIRTEYLEIKKFVTNKHELEVANSKFEALLWLNFMYCCFILIVGGLADSGFYQNNPSSPFILVANASLFVGILVIANLVFYPPWEKSNWYTGIFLALAALPLACLYRCWTDKGIVDCFSNMTTIFITFGMILLPFFVVFLRIPAFKKVVCPIIRFKTRKISRKSNAIIKQIEKSSSE